MTPQPRRPSALGEADADDQLVSPTLDLIAQMTGYKYATIFVDHYSGVSLVYLQQVASAEEISDAQRAFERSTASMGVSINANHANNGIFKAKEWVTSCHNK